MSNFFVECALARETHGATLMERNGKQESQLCCSLCLVSTEDANNLQQALKHGENLEKKSNTFLFTPQILNIHIYRKYLVEISLGTPE